MPSMSYCRWENTSGEMSQCVEAMKSFNERDEEACADNQASIDAGEAIANDNPTPTKLETLSSYERQGLMNCLALAAEMLELAGDELLAEAGVSLHRLAA